MGPSIQARTRGPDTDAGPPMRFLAGDCRSGFETVMRVLAEGRGCPVMPRGCEGWLASQVAACPGTRRKCGTHETQSFRDRAPALSASRAISCAHAPMSIDGEPRRQTCRTGAVPTLSRSSRARHRPRSRNRYCLARGLSAPGSVKNTGSVNPCSVWPLPLSTSSTTISLRPFLSHAPGRYKVCCGPMLQ